MKEKIGNITPLGCRTVLKVEKITKKDKEGNEYTDLSRQALVLATDDSLLGIKKGDIVYYNPRGCINIEAKETKKDMVLIVDNCDLYGKL